MNNLPEVRSVWRRVILTVGYTFLYAPMLMLVIYSFNSSKLVTVWAGWSTRWYTQLFNDSAMISAVGLSLTIAAASATMAVVLGNDCRGGHGALWAFSWVNRFCFYADCTAGYA